MKNLCVLMTSSDIYKKGLHSFFASFSIKKGSRSFLRKNLCFGLPTRRGVKTPRSVPHRSDS